MAQQDIFRATTPQLTPRPYQIQAVEANLKAWGDGARGCLNVLATGLGKSLIAVMHAKDAQGRVLIVAPKKEIVWQLANEIRRVTGEHPGVEMAELESAGERVVIGTPDSLHRRLVKFESNPFALVIVDEVHHVLAATWQKIVDAFPLARRLGLTATPDRGDGRALGAIFDVTTIALQLDWSWAESWLVPAIGRTVDIAGNDLRKVKSTAGDFDSGALARAISAAHESMVDKVLETFTEPAIGERSTIFFAPSKDAAHEITHMFNRRRAGMAVAVDGEMDTGERGRAFDAIRSGAALVIVNYGVIVEGVDVPNVSNIVFGRPTRKRWIAVQMAGRGLRPSTGVLDHLSEASASERAVAISGSKKPNCLWTDFVWLSKHELMTPVHLALGGTEQDARVAKRVGRETRKGATDLTQAIDRARKREKKLEDDRQVRERATAERLQLKLKSYDPMAGATSSGQDISPGRRKEMTLEQGRRLLALGYFPEEIHGWSTGQAGAALAEAKRRRLAGLATKRQLAVLRRSGIPSAELVSLALASRIIDAGKKYGWDKTRRARNVRAAIESEISSRRP